MGISTETPDYLVIGHVAKDLTAHGPRPGGTVLYSGLTAQRLGLQAAVVTACAQEDEWLLSELRETGVSVAVRHSPQTTTYTNRYDDEGRRTQLLTGNAGPLTLSDIPPAWRSAPIVHLGPIAQEVAPDFPTSIIARLLGITPQGWLRRWDARGRVTQSAVPIPAALGRLPAHTIVVLSQEDLNHNGEFARDYVKCSPYLVLTAGGAPASVFYAGMELVVPAFPATLVDPTGAGDVFSAALLIYFRETGNIEEATKFAHGTAALSVGAHGTQGIPGREQVDRFLAALTAPNHDEPIQQHHQR